jgi:3-oxosteroid 1-dehydrogenase
MNDLAWDDESDVVVVGSGSGALTFALTAADRGASVILLERAPQLGGGTSYAGGLVWIPNNHHIAEEGLSDSEEDAFAYLHRISGGKHHEDVMAAFVKRGPEVVRYLEEKAGFTFEISKNSPDYNAELEGGKESGRALAAPLFDSAGLGEWQDKLLHSPHFEQQSTFPEVTRWGGINNTGEFDANILTERKNRGIVGWGMAYIGYLLKACLDGGVRILLEHRARELVMDGDEVAGVLVDTADGRKRIRATRAVMLGAGGFEWNAELRKRMPWPDFQPYSVPTNEGDGVLMGLKVGAAMATLDVTSSFSIKIPGETHMGHQLYRIASLEVAAPGTLVVNRAGKRFGNESFWPSVNDGMRYYDPELQVYPNMPAWAVFDQDHKDHYPIANIPPGNPAPDWLVRADTLAGLAEELGIDPDGLNQTVAVFNEYAVEGVDPDFHRGARALDAKFGGDLRHKPNPCLGEVKKAPYYAVEIHLSTSGTRSGLVIDANGRVKDVFGAPIPGLYACPNTAAHLACGLGYTSGLVIAQSTVFGHLAALDATS